MANNGKELADRALETLSSDLEAGNSEALTNYLTAIAKFHDYSFGNLMLIAHQRPSATHVAGFHTWLNSFDRHVKKGEKGIMILAPMIGKKKAEESESDEATKHLYGFRAVYVFDVEQTEGKPIPAFTQTLGDPAEKLTAVKALIQSKGIGLSYSDDLNGAFGLSHNDSRIEILNGLGAAHEFSVLVHELAHELLHKGARRKETSRKVRETEAEAVSFVVAQAIGLDTNTAAVDYIKLYNGDKDTLAESLQYIRNTAVEIIDALSAEPVALAAAA